MGAFTIPWKAWYGDEELALKFPAGWEVRSFPMADGPDIGERGIRESLSSPVQSLPLANLAKGKGSAVLVVDDISRPTPAHRILPFVLCELKRAGINEQRVRIIMSLGAHRPMLRDDLIKKLGTEAWNTVEIHNHHPYENLVHLGTSSRGTPIDINRLFMESDLKIGIGCVVPHCYAGFGGGGKIVLPGISGIRTLESNHQPATKGLKGGLGVVEGNEVRQDIEEIAQRVGLDVIINAVVTSKRGIAGLFTGDVVKAHRQGVALAHRVYSTEVPTDLDVAILNAYPKDTELFQASLALDFFLSAGERLVRKEGVIVVATASPEGEGYHSLEGYQMKLYGLHDKFPPIQTAIGDRTLCLFAPSVTPQAIRKYYSLPVLVFREWEELVSYLRGRFPKRCQVGIFPSASIQLGSDMRGTG